jgi:hypothetical protein
MKAIKKLSRHDIGVMLLLITIVFLVIGVALGHNGTGFVFVFASFLLDIFAGYELDIFKGLNKGKVRQ